MAVIVAFAIVVAQKRHGIVLCNVLWVLLYKTLDAIPQGWNGLDILVQAQDKAVLLLIVLHEPKRVVMDIAEQLHTWLNTPVVLELVHERMTEEETGLEAAHVPVAD